jgi:aminomethyltransferase
MSSKKTPFDRLARVAGAEMREMFGYWLPWEYAAGAVKEHLATRLHVSVCDLDYMAEFRIEGPEALAFVQTVMTNSFNSLRSGRIRYTAMCDENGNMVDDGTVWRIGESEFMFISGSETDHDWLTKQAADFDVRLTNITDDWTTLAIQGPSSRSVMDKVVGRAAVDSLRYYSFTQTRIGGSDCIVAQMGYTGETGYELHFVPSLAESVWQTVTSAGEEYGIVPCGQAALESLRQEAGYLLVGNDHNRSTNPFEVGIGSVVRFDKPKFNGREALSEIVRRGIDRTIVWLALEGPAVAQAGDGILVGAESVGAVTSGSFSPTIEKGVAIGYVHPRHAIHGTSVSVRTGGTTEPARLSVMPLYDPGDVRTKGWVLQSSEGVF